MSGLTPISAGYGLRPGGGFSSFNVTITRKGAELINYSTQTRKAGLSRNFPSIGRLLLTDELPTDQALNFVCKVYRHGAQIGEGRHSTISPASTILMSAPSPSRAAPRLRPWWTPAAFAAMKYATKPPLPWATTISVSMMTPAPVLTASISRSAGGTPATISRRHAASQRLATGRLPARKQAAPCGCASNATIPSERKDALGHDWTQHPTGTAPTAKFASAIRPSGNGCPLPIHQNDNAAHLHRTGRHAPCLRILRLQPARYRHRRSGT